MPGDGGLDPTGLARKTGEGKRKIGRRKEGREEHHRTARSESTAEREHGETTAGARDQVPEVLEVYQQGGVQHAEGSPGLQQQDESRKCTSRTMINPRKQKVNSYSAIVVEYSLSCRSGVPIITRPAILYSQSNSQPYTPYASQNG